MSTSVLNKIELPHCMCVCSLPVCMVLHQCDKAEGYYDVTGSNTFRLMGEGWKGVGGG